MVKTPKPIRKKAKESTSEIREFLRKHNPQPTKQHEKKMIKKQTKHEVKLNVFESPKHEKIRKQKGN